MLFDKVNYYITLPINKRLQLLYRHVLRVTTTYIDFFLNVFRTSEIIAITVVCFLVQVQRSLNAKPSTPRQPHKSCGSNIDTQGHHHQHYYYNFTLTHA